MTAGMRPAPRPRAAQRRQLAPARVVQPVAATRKGGAGFMWLVAAIALGSALCLLVLNTLRSEQSFTLTTLQSHVATLEDQQQALESDISALSAPEAIALKADSMGLVHASSVRFVQRSTGKVLGVSTSPQAGYSIAVNTLPQSTASEAASDVLGAGGIGLHVGVTAPRAATSSTPSAPSSSKAASQGQSIAPSSPGVSTTPANTSPASTSHNASTTPAKK